MSKRKNPLKTFLLLNTLAFAGMYAINRFIEDKACAKHMLSQNKGNIYHWTHGDIYYQVSGKGDRPLLLIHDATVYSSGYEWSRLIPQLERDFTVYTVDLLGCGRSAKPAMTYTNYLYVQLISSFISEVMGGEAEVAATGLSASFAVMATLSAPYRIKKLTMINPWNPEKLSEVPNRTSQALGVLMALPILGTTLYHILNCRSNLEYLLDEKCFYNPFKVRAKLLDACYEASHRGNGSGRYLLACLDGKYLNWNVNRAVSLLSQPVTILYGDKLQKEKASAKAYSRLNPDIRTKAIPMSKMFPHLEEPEAVSACLR